MPVMRRIDHFSFFFNDTATTEIYTLSLHDALPISGVGGLVLAATTTSAAATVVAAATACGEGGGDGGGGKDAHESSGRDRKSTRLNSSHAKYLVCRLLLEKKKRKQIRSGLYASHIS